MIFLKPAAVMISLANPTGCRKLGVATCVPSRTDVVDTAAFSFASTYALGQVAKRYYAGGRKIDAAGLQQAFTEMLGQARQLQTRYTGQIAEQARTLDLNKLLAAVRP